MSDDICPECGSGIVNGEHIVPPGHPDYPCSRNPTAAEIWAKVVQPVRRFYDPDEYWEINGD